MKKRDWKELEKILKGKVKGYGKEGMSGEGKYLVCGKGILCDDCEDKGDGE
ncbi:hypothetical protein BMS3Abin17_01234 [archaeon BMS3Abin17]|nr:hypothetical protein BMS3Abin17_01234 [archaeon BMS3Abin17]